MFFIKDAPILEDELDVLKTIKLEAHLRLGKDILKKMKKSGDNIMICCPQHSFGQERRPSCGVTTVKRGDKPAGTVHCFSCGYTDDLIGMTQKILEFRTRGEAELWLSQKFVLGEVEHRTLPELDLNRNKVIQQIKPEYVSEDELKTYREFYHEYMWQRKLTPEIVDKYDVGYQKDFRLKTKNEDGTEKLWPPIECLTFPVRDINGNVLFVSRRAIHNKTFFLPLNIPKPLYGVYELPKDCRQVIVCESVFNALTCVRYGRPAIALFGTGDNSQYDLLNKLPVRSIVLGLDPDTAGENGCKKLKKALHHKLLSRLIIPKGKDINDLSEEEFKNLPEIMY